MAQIGIPGLILILVLALILFGPSKLPQLGRAIGDTLREFRNSTKHVVEDVTEDKKDKKKEEAQSAQV